MAEYLECGDCSYFAPLILGNGNGKCVKHGIDVCETSVHCCYFTSIKKKVRPRRLCDFCERHKLIDDEYGNYKIGCLKLIPLPEINLTTGEKSDQKRNVAYSMFVYESDGDGGEVGSFQIKFCPYCGRKLKAENAEEKED